MTGTGPSIHRHRDSIRACLQRLRAALEAADSPARAAALGHRNESASMSLRKLHGFMGGDARAGHCREALYRSEEADALLAGPLPSGNTPIHCEHTIPVSIAVRQLWQVNRAWAGQTGDKHKREAALLEQVFRLTVVTACSQRERHCDLGLAKLRAYGSDPCRRRWSRHHPEFAPGAEWHGELRPFLRYHGTTVRVICASSGRPIDPERFSLQDHWERIKLLPGYDAASYF